MSSTDAGSERLLGPPILKLPQCPLHVPEAWRSALLEHLDGKARVVVAQTSKAGLQWVLQEWPNATLTFLVGPASSSERPTEDTLRRALAARQQLSVRGDRPTVLQLKHEGDGTTRHETWWHIAFSALGSRDPVPNLALSLQLPHMSRNLLSFAGTAFRGLNKLSLGAPGTSIDAQMPLSARLPALRHLVVHAVLGSSQAKFWESVAPYMTQLVSLAIKQQTEVATDPTTLRPMWCRVLSSATSSQTLTSIQLPEELSPWVVKLLQHAPRLQSVSVTGIFTAFAVIAADVPSACSWSTLHFTHSTFFPASAWHWLPMPADGKLVLSVSDKDPTPREMDIALPLTDAVALKLTSMELKGYNQIRVTAESLGPSAQPEAVRTALPLLQPLQAPGFELVLNDLTMTEALAAELHTVAAAGWDVLSLQALEWPAETVITAPLRALSFIDLAAPLDDAGVPKLARVVPAPCHLYVPALALRSKVGPEVTLPWDKVTVDGDQAMAVWLEQVRLMGGDLTWACEELTLCMSADEVKRNEHVAMTRQLKGMKITSVSKLVITAHNELGTGEAAALRASLAVLQAMPCKPEQVVLSGWAAKAECIRELHALLHMPVMQKDRPSACKLHLCLRSMLSPFGLVPWGPQPWPIARLPVCIPSGAFSTWRIEGGSLHADALETFVLSLPAGCTEASPLTVEVDGMDAAWAVGMNARLRKLGTYPHVTLVGLT